jgi:hypothetical protein
MMSALRSPTMHRYDRLRLLIGLLAPLVVIVFVAASCSDDDTDSSDGTTTTSTTAAPTTEPGPIDGGETAVCDEDEIDRVMRELLASPEGPEIDRVEITDCAGGYARVIVVPVEANFESEQVFIHQVGGSWEVIDFGTGISCEDDDLGVELASACAALGLD